MIFDRNHSVGRKFRTQNKFAAITASAQENKLGIVKPHLIRQMQHSRRECWPKLFEMFFVSAKRPLPLGVGGVRNVVVRGASSGMEFWSEEFHVGFFALNRPVAPPSSP